MIKYAGIKYRDERKEYRGDAAESSGRWLEARMVAGAGKCVRERAQREKSEK